MREEKIAQGVRAQERKEVRRVAKVKKQECLKELLQMQMEEKHELELRLEKVEKEILFLKKMGD